MDSDPDQQWFYDKISPTMVQGHKLKQVLFLGQSNFQSVEIVETYNFGKCLILDGKLQSSAVDEFIYHEALVHPALLAHPRPESVYIAGGGEGATLREVLAHKTVKRAVMVDIDDVVVKLSREHLPSYGNGAFEDKRTELFATNARAHLAQSKDKFDAIVIDLPEPIQEGPAYLLYTEEFYRLVQEELNPGGVMSVQSGTANWVDPLNFASVVRTLKSIFPIVRPFQAVVPSYGPPWSFCVASNTIDPQQITPEELDKRIAARGLNLRWYDGVTHHGLFDLPKHMRQMLATTGRVIRDKEPLFVYNG